MKHALALKLSKIFLPYCVRIYNCKMTKPFSMQNLLAGKLSAGVNVFFGLTGCAAERVEDFVTEQLGFIRATHASALPAGFAASRQLFKSLHIDPTKHRPSAEALWRRLRDKDDFPRLHPLVDLTNLLSLKFQISFGLYDLDHILGPVTICLGDENDHYQGIRKETLNFKGKIVLRDAQGAFGNPSADSLRASVGENSSNIMQVLFFHAQDESKKMLLAEAATLYKRFFAMDSALSLLIETDAEQGISLEGETCKTNAAQTRLPNPG